MVNVRKSIAILGCFDTKGADFAFLRARILAYGESVVTINTGVYRSVADFQIDVEVDEVTAAGGEGIGKLRKSADRGRAVEVMGQGAAAVLGRLYDAGKLKAVIGMGGGGSTFIALAAMQAVPLGIPKLCLSTVATKDLSRQAGFKDITLMAAVVDIAGLNRISRMQMKQAAAAICGMANAAGNEEQEEANKGCIAISMFGNTTACVTKCVELLSQQGYETLVFHTNGVGGQAMESLIREGCIAGVLDITTTELADELCGGVCSAGPSRLDAAAQCGVPQVVVPGCLDMVNFAHRDTVSDPYQHRQLYNWAPDVTLMRTNADENRQLGLLLARKVNQSEAPVAVLLPLLGLSQLDNRGGIFEAPEINSVLFATIKDTVESRVAVYELDAHINDAEFATEVVNKLVALMEDKR